MSRLIIDGTEYVPFVDFENITPEMIKGCIQELVSIQYFNIKHKNKSMAWNALNFLSRNLAQLVSKDEKVAYDLMNGTENDCNDYGQENGHNGRPEYTPKVTLDGIEYVPDFIQHNLKKNRSESVEKCLIELISLIYFDEEHKSRAVAWDAINALDPKLAKLCADDVSKAYKLTKQ